MKGTSGEGLYPAEAYAVLAAAEAGNWQQFPGKFPHLVKT